jgi:myotubularin-related protein 9
MYLLQLLHHNVDAVERRLNGMQGGSLIIKCKDFRVIQLDICTPDEFLKVATTVENLSSLGKCML